MKYECTLCEFTTWDRMEISKHLKTHAASIKCARPLSSPRKNPSNTYRCFQCSYITDSDNEISNHLLSHADSFHVCGTCRRRFDSRATLAKHQNMNHKNTSKFSKTDVLTSPFAAKHTPTFKLSSCHPVSKKKPSESVQKFTNQNPSKCEADVSSCSQKSPVAVNAPDIKDPVIKSTVALKTLKSRKTSGSNKKVVEKSTIFFVVDPSSSGSADQQSHPAGPQAEILYPCNQCDEFFASSFGLSCHKENVHKYKCSIADCCRVFFDPAIFRDHMAEHENQKRSLRK